MESRKQTAIRITLTSNYVSKSVIKHVLGSSNKIAGEIFYHCKDRELKLSPLINGERLDIRPTKVPTDIFLKLTNQDYNFLRKQYMESKRRQNE